MQAYPPNCSRSGRSSRWMKPEVCLRYLQVTQDLTLLLVGVIGRPTDPSAKTSTDGPLGIILPAPLRTPSKIEREGANGMALPEPPPPSQLRYPSQKVPGNIQEVTSGAGCPTDTRGSIVRWRDKVPKRWDLLNVNGDPTQEGEVSNGWRSCLIYNHMYL